MAYILLHYYLYSNDTSGSMMDKLKGYLYYIMVIDFIVAYFMSRYSGSDEEDDVENPKGGQNYTNEQREQMMRNIDDLKRMQMISSANFGAGHGGNPSNQLTQKPNNLIGRKESQGQTQQQPQPKREPEKQQENKEELEESLKESVKDVQSQKSPFMSQDEIKEEEKKKNNASKSTPIEKDSPKQQKQKEQKKKEKKIEDTDIPVYKSSTVSKKSDIEEDDD